MPHYGGKPARCLLDGGSLVFTDSLYGGVQHRFQCSSCEMNGFWSNNKNETDPIPESERLDSKEMRRLIEYALIGWRKNPTVSIEDTALMEKVRNLAALPVPETLSPQPSPKTD
jgi:hypothetical protein